MKTTPKLCWLLLAAASASSAQTPPTFERPPPPQIGSSRDYDGAFLTINCRHWEVKKIEANNIVVRQCDDKLHYYHAADFSTLRVTNLKGDVLVEFKPQHQGLSFPLFVGKKWSSRYAGFRADKNRKWDSLLECEAKAYEPVNVPAGTFDAFRVECVDNWEFGYIFSGKAVSTRWYAPAEGIIIKSVSEDKDWNFELAAFKQASPARERTAAR